MEMIPNVQSLISKKVTEERKTHKEISDELKQIYPEVSGLSSRSVRRFCNAHDIHSMSLLTDPDLDRVVSSSIAKVRLCSRVLRGLIHYTHAGRSHLREKDNDRSSCITGNSS